MFRSAMKSGTEVNLTAIRERSTCSNAINERLFVALLVVLATTATTNTRELPSVPVLETKRFKSSILKYDSHVVRPFILASASHLL